MEQKSPIRGNPNILAGEDEMAETNLRPYRATERHLEPENQSSGTRTPLGQLI